MHTQGRRLVPLGVTRKPGTIHAHAGQTFRHCHDQPEYGNHPCTRRADFYWGFSVLHSSEPSMHTRGRRSRGAYRLQLCGTIHAHAGQTFCSRARWGIFRNHPCTRGADEMRDFLDMRGLEPSMHTRGRHNRIHLRESGQGTIHAHAGQTRLRRVFLRCVRNHPCTRGADCVHMVYGYGG